MDLDDLLLYGDLDDLHAQEQQKSKELLASESKYNDALKEAETLRVEIKALEKKIKTITVNFQNLLDTAKAEIRRKDAQIQQLRKEKDDICFRRQKPQASAERFADDEPQQQHYSDYAASQASANPFKRQKASVPSATALPVDGTSTQASTHNWDDDDTVHRWRLSKQIGDNRKARSSDRSDEYSSNRQRRDFHDLKGSKSHEPRLGNGRDKSGADKDYSADEKRIHINNSKEKNNGRGSAHSRLGQREVKERSDAPKEAHKAAKIDLHYSDTKHVQEKPPSQDKNSIGLKKSRSLERSQSRDVYPEKSKKNTGSDCKSTKEIITCVSTVKDHQTNAKEAIDKKKSSRTSQTTSGNDSGQHNKPESAPKTAHSLIESVENDKRAATFNLKTEKLLNRSISIPDDTKKFVPHLDEGADENSNFATVHQLNTPKNVALFDSLFGPSPSSTGSSSSLLMRNTGRLLSTDSTMTSMGDYTDTTANNTPKAQRCGVDATTKPTANIDLNTNSITTIQFDEDSVLMEHSGTGRNNGVENTDMFILPNASGPTTDAIVSSDYECNEEEKAAMTTSKIEAIKNQQVALSDATEKALNILSSEELPTAQLRFSFEETTSEITSGELPGTIEGGPDDNGTVGELMSSNIDLLNFSSDKEMMDGDIDSDILYADLDILKHNSVAKQTFEAVAERTPVKPTPKNNFKSPIEILENIRLPSLFVKSTPANTTPLIDTFNATILVDNSKKPVEIEQKTNTHPLKTNDSIKLYPKNLTSETPNIAADLKQGEKIKEVVQICQENTSQARQNPPDESQELKLGTIVASSAIDTANQILDSSENVLRKSVKEIDSSNLLKTPQQSPDKDNHELAEIFSTQRVNEPRKRTLSNESNFSKDSSDIEIAKRQLRELESNSERHRRLSKVNQIDCTSKEKEDGVSVISDNVIPTEKRHDEPSAVKSKVILKVNITNGNSKPSKLSNHKRSNAESPIIHKPVACEKQSNGDTHKLGEHMKTKELSQETETFIAKLVNETAKPRPVLEERVNKKQSVPTNLKGSFGETKEKSNIQLIKKNVSCENAAINDSSDSKSSSTKTANQITQHLTIKAICSDSKNAKGITMSIGKEKSDEKVQKIHEQEWFEATSKVNRSIIKTEEKKKNLFTSNAFVKGTIPKMKVAPIVIKKTPWSNNFQISKAINRHRRIVDSNSDDDDKPSTSKTAIALMKSRGVWIAPPSPTITTPSFKKNVPESNWADICKQPEFENLPILELIKAKNKMRSNNLKIIPKNDATQSSKSKQIKIIDEGPNYWKIDNKRSFTQTATRTRTETDKQDSSTHSVGILHALHLTTSNEIKVLKTSETVQKSIKDDGQKGIKEYAPVVEPTNNWPSSSVVNATETGAAAMPPEPSKPLKRTHDQLCEDEGPIAALAMEHQKKARVENTESNPPAVGDGSAILAVEPINSSPYRTSSAANTSQDIALNEVDSRMQLMFSSPTYSERFQQPINAVDTSIISATQSPPMEEVEQTNVTIDETVNNNASSSLLDQSSTQDSDLNSSIKRISLGSSEYRIEKVDDNVVKMFITRKRGKKKMLPDRASTMSTGG